MGKIIAVSAGQYDYKKTENPIKTHIRYLNYGMLGLVTMLNDTLGIDSIMIQGDGKTPEELVNRLLQTGIDIKNSCECFLLSIPSFYSVSWCRDFCEIVKRRFDKRVIVGGRWVVDNRAEWVRDKLEHVDMIIEGFGEKKLAELFCPEKADEIEDGLYKVFGRLNYKLLIDYQSYQPSIEISRGCGAGCAFCQDRGNRRLKNKAVSEVLEELDFLDTIYDNYTLYLEAPHFHFERKWCEEFAEGVKKRGKVIPWRCTSRVDSIPLDLIGTLATSGLKIVDIGLESASAKQLIRMHKTQHPEKYLEKAVQILEECNKHNVWVKFNILLYAKETSDTITETLDWLNKYKHLIKGVSVSSLVYYMDAGDLDSILLDGASIPEGWDVRHHGYVDLNLSEEICAQKAKTLCLSISRSVMSAKDYYDMKSISYFERGYTYEMFAEEIDTCNWEELPFYK